MSKTASRIHEPVFGLEEGRRAIAPLLDPVEELARNSQHLFSAHVRYQTKRLEARALPRFLFVGPRGDGQEFFRIGLFAGVHGDETAGVHALLSFLRQLEEKPEIAGGYEIFAYPFCNPDGFVAGTRWSASGKDLNREFWKDSEEPEVKVLQRQIEHLRFHGLISLHSDDTSEGLYGFVSGHSLTRYMLEPALTAAERVLPRNYDRQIDNFEADNGIIEKGYTGILSAPPWQKPRPFELVFETPQLAPMDKQCTAFCLALESMLTEYRSIISEGQNI